MYISVQNDEKENIISFHQNSGSHGGFLSAFQRALLMKEASKNLRPEYSRRIEIMLLADQGYSQAQICKVLGCAQQTARHWIAIAQSGQVHLWNDDPIGRPKTINDQFTERLKELVAHSPKDYGYSFSAWTGDWLRKQLAKEFGIEVSNRHINRLLSQLGLSIRSRRSKTHQKAQDQQSASIKILDLEPTVSDKYECMPSLAAGVGGWIGAIGLKTS